MPVIKSAIKKLRKDRNREKENDHFRNKLAKAIKTARRGKSEKSLKEAISLIDKAAKKNIIHKNRAARLKSSLSKLTKTTARIVSKKPAPKAKTTSIPKKKPRSPKK